VKNVKRGQSTITSMKWLPIQILDLVNAPVALLQSKHVQTILTQASPSANQKRIKKDGIRAKVSIVKSVERCF
jgi:hypothetical protein